MADTPTSFEDKDVVERSMDDLVMEYVEEHHDGEAPETVEMRVNGGEWQEVPFEVAMDSLLEQKSVDVPLRTTPADVGVASGSTPSDCHPAIIYNVIAFGATGSVEVQNTEGVPPSGGSPACDVIGAETYSGAAQVTIQAPSGASTGAVANAGPGFVAAGGSTALGWGTAQGYTPHCVLVVEINFFGIYIGQTGTGMPGCGPGDVSAVGVIGAGAGAPAPGLPGLPGLPAPPAP